MSIKSTPLPAWAFLLLTAGMPLVAHAQDAKTIEVVYDSSGWNEDTFTALGSNGGALVFSCGKSGASLSVRLTGDQGEAVVANSAEIAQNSGAYAITEIEVFTKGNEIQELRGNLPRPDLSNVMVEFRGSSAIRLNTTLADGSLHNIIIHNSTSDAKADRAFRRFTENCQTL